MRERHFTVSIYVLGKQTFINNLGSFFIDTLRNEMKSEITISWCYLVEIETNQ